MKKFAKYLPVEGEIEVPCIVLETLTNGKTELFQVDNFNDINLETQKLAKLFLCSRDITFPCNIYCFGEKVWRKNCNSTSCNECVKVIGEISPNAIWVTEGMEFDEDDIEIHLSKDLKITIAIKCPTCKQFH